MRRIALVLGLTFAVGIAVGVMGHQVLYAQQMQVKRTELIKTDLAGIPGREGVMWIPEIPPGAASGKHYHPGHNFVYVLEGTLTYVEEGKPPVTRKAGEAFHELPMNVHEGKNTSTTGSVKVLVFQAAEKGKPLTVSVK